MVRRVPDAGAGSTLGILLFLVLAVIPALSSGWERCLPKDTEMRRRYLSYNGTTLNITMQVSGRTSHKLATAVLEIVLREKLGYEDVITVPEPYGITLPDIIVDQLSAFGPQYTKRLPLAIVNLEVMVPADFDNAYYLTEKTSSSVQDYGDLAPPVRQGWLVFGPEQRQYNWKDFAVPQKYFSLSELDVEKYSTFTDDASNIRYYCEENYCVNGTYTPDRCTFVSCTTLLTTFPPETSFIIDHIEKLNLYVKVAWVGPNLLKVLNEVKVNSTTAQIIALDWSPTHTELISQKYTRVSMPPCEKPDDLGCKYEMTRITKYGWSKLNRLAYHIYYAFSNAHFTIDEYNQLLRYYTNSNEQNIHSAACSWVKSNQDKIKKWVWPKKDVIAIGGIFPFTGTSYSGFGISTASNMAADAINRNTSVLSNYDIKMYQDDGECQADKVMKTFIDFILLPNVYDKLLGIVGPACSETLEPLAGVSKHYRTAVISYSAEGMSFSDREKYPYFFRTIGENRQYKHVYYRLFKSLGWKRVAALTEDGQKRTEYISYMENFLVNNGIEFIANTKFPKDEKNVSLTLYLDELRGKRARIIIADVDEATARALVCVALRQGMTARSGYVWFLPPWLPRNWYDAPGHNIRFNETVPCSLEEMKEAIDGHFSVAHAPFAEDDALMQENISVNKWRENYNDMCDSDWDDLLRGQHASNPYLPEDGDLRSPYAGYAYDAVWTYAYALDRLLKDHPAAISDLHHEKYFNLLIRNIEETNFDGVSGNIRFRGGSSRFSVINIRQWVGNDSKIVGTFYPNISETRPEIIDGKLVLDESKIVWLANDGNVPDDGMEKCTFQLLSDTFNIDCHQSFVVFNIMMFVLVVLILVGAFFYCKRRFERRYKKHMLSMGLDVLNPMKIATLDKWEIPREQIVINRKLGVGAFGTVYGGHALFSEEKGWTAVAVKTLKPGSTTEEKLDFLSEAEAMKRFEHKNIVKLLAVITKTEPVCTVMEFMLYGDLKNYLLGRRHLVNERDTEESEEISGKKLTNMALDVARALSYLADLKYVHRDVACRNCLVSSHRVIKLGDFGMTRLIFENDYYRFSRKGLLPVRWMAPESLGLGIFSQASDIWSFGVLLYEIITFGSLPFQGLSNSEVLDHVKKGNTITLPSGTKPQLEGLIKSCWNRDYKKRPHASEIAEFLANNPRLLAPCLDVPLDSFNLDNSAQWRLLPESGKVEVGVSYGKPRILNRDTSVAGLSTSAQLAQSTSTNLTYVSTDLSLPDQHQKNDFQTDLFDDEKASFL